MEIYGGRKLDFGRLLGKIAKEIGLAQQLFSFGGAVGDVAGRIEPGGGKADGPPIQCFG